MAENRYNVDDILREVKEKRAREERTARPEGRREATTPEDLLRQLDAAQAGVRKTAASTSKPQPTPANIFTRGLRVAFSFCLCYAKEKG